LIFAGVVVAAIAVVSLIARAWRER
jgi:hypothetical protein